MAFQSRAKAATGKPIGSANSRPAARNLVPLVFRPGEAFQFDWSEDWAVLGGERTKLQVAHFKLSHSRAFIVRAYFCKPTRCCLTPITTPSGLGGVPRRGIYDNMRTAVDRVGRGKDRQVNARFSAMVSHYSVRRGVLQSGFWLGKGASQKNVQDARHRFWQPTPFRDLDALKPGWNSAASNYGRKSRRSSPGTIADALAEEVHSLMPQRPFDRFVEHAKRVSPTCLVHLERNRYSVPASFANRPVSVRVYPERIVIARKGRSYANISGSSSDPTTCPGERFMTGAIIWR